MTIPNLIKSEFDVREYRYIQLENGLRAVLVSDKENPTTNGDTVQTERVAGKRRYSEIEDKNEDNENDSHPNVDKLSVSSDGDDDDDDPNENSKKKLAACALTVSVGTLSDPPHIEGLAHFVEHMVFMGSEKYPKENALDEFLQKHCGYTNGQTDYETTTFSMECDQNALPQAVDMFANFFIRPLMLREAMTRERNAVDSEFQLCVTSEEERVEQLLSNLAPAGHPLRKFPWGNLKTLRDNVSDDELYKATHEFRSRHYSAHRMTLAIIGCMSLDDLEEIVRTSFSDVPNNNLPPFDFSPYANLYGTEDFHSYLWVKPVSDVFEIALVWSLPSLVKEYKSHPLHYVAWFIKNEGPGGLLSYLREKVWVIGVSAGNDYTEFDLNSMHSLFSISLILTDSGFENLNLVLDEVFSYLAMLRKELPSERHFFEQKEIADTRYRFQNEMDPGAQVIEISQLLHERELHLILASPLFLEYRPDLIKMVIDHLRYEHVLILVQSKSMNDDFYTSVEPYFGTKYKLESDCQLDMFLEISETKFEQSDYPVEIVKNDLLEIWYRQDIKFKRPQSIYHLKSTVHLVHQSALNQALLLMLVKFLNIKLLQMTYQASCANFIASLAFDECGLVINVNGFSSKLPQFYESVLKAIKTECDKIADPANGPLFEALKKDLVRNMRNALNVSSYYCQSIRLSILMHNTPIKLEMINALTEITQDQLQQLANEFFSSFYTQIIVQGNVSKETAIGIGQYLQKCFNHKPVPKEKNFTTILPLGETYCRAIAFNEEEKNAILFNYYQVGPDSILMGCIIELLTNLINEPLFNTLRTQKQIGYDISAEINDTYNILGFSFDVKYVGDSRTPEEVDEILEEFLNVFVGTLKAMPDDEFESAKLDLQQSKKLDDLDLISEVTRNFGEIASDKYIFNRQKLEIEEIENITKEMVCEFTEQYVIRGGKDVRKLSIQIIPGNIPKSDNDVKYHLLTMEGKNCILDIGKFKSSCSHFTCT